MAKVGFVGLGVMGGPMAGHLLRAGHDLTIWNRTPGKTEDLARQGAKVAGSLADVGAAADAIFLCVNRSEDVAECLAGLTENARLGTLFVDHSTIAPAAAQQFHADLSARGFRFVDAPITGGSMGAQQGRLTIFCGGIGADVAAALPFLAAYAQRAERVGGPGAGQLMKMANQIAVGGALLALCECLSFCAKAGLDAGQAWEMIGSGAAGSWAFANYGPKVLARDWSPGFSVKNQRKDFGYCREAAQALDAAIPGVELVDRLLAQADDPEQTTAVLFDILRRQGAEAPC